MLCPRCGADCGDAIRLCDNCESMRQEREAAQPEHFENEVRNADEFSSAPYAGFWMRVCACLFDAVILGVPFAGINWILESRSTMLSSQLLPSAKASVSTSLLVGIFAGAIILLLLAVLLFIVSWFYYAISESSPMRGTPGKRLAGMIVTDLHGDTISFKRASCRYFAKILSGGGLGLGFLMPLFNAQKQALHDKLSGCVIRKAERRNPLVLAVCAILSLVVLSAIQPEKERQRIVIDNSRPGSRVIVAGSPDQRIEPTAFVQPRELEVPVASAAQPSTPPVVVADEPKDEFHGPHARIRADGAFVDARTALAFYYPKNNSVSIGFYAEQLSPSDVDLIKRRGVLTSGSNGERPVMTMSLDFNPGLLTVGKEHLKSYGVSFRQSTMAGFSFASVNDVVAFSKDAKLLPPDERVQVQGVLSNGGKIHLVMRGKGSPRTNLNLKFSWDLDVEVVLFPSR